MTKKAKEDAEAKKGAIESLKRINGEDERAKDEEKSNKVKAKADVEASEAKLKQKSAEDLADYKASVAKKDAAIKTKEKIAAKEKLGNATEEAKDAPGCV
jgi:cell division septum initiation protein DivIVA